MDETNAYYAEQVLGNKNTLEKLGEIKKTEVIATNGPDKSATEDHLNSVTYSISQLLSFVNSKDLLRYIPDDFLDSDRIDAKRKAIAETQEYTDEKNDKKYSNFVKQGNLSRQYALPIDVDSFVANSKKFATPTLSTVGKERMTYKEKAFSKDRLFTKKTSAYIHAVDEQEQKS